MSDASLSVLHVWVHGARPEVHDYHSGNEGDFERLAGQLGQARRSGIEVIATTMLTRSNLAVIGEVPAFLAARGIRAWRVAVARAGAGAEAEAEDGPSTVFVRLALALPYALHALTRASRSGIETYVAGAPLCLLGPFAAHALPTTEGAYGDACEACPAQSACPGVDGRYLARFDGDELRPRSTPTPPTPPRTERWAASFSGVMDPGRG
ncbi:MAG: hypothetical protein JRH11_10780 [Deltaproteobacteria bacterium]|nr:hypothetical protein [Deltaproteobacteria bacterium]